MAKSPAGRCLQANIVQQTDHVLPEILFLNSLSVHGLV